MTAGFRSSVNRVIHIQASSLPPPTDVQAIAGACPVTRRSGKRQHAYFRRACDREFRHIARQWAKQTLDVSPWAQANYRSVFPYCHTKNDTIRRLAVRKFLERAIVAAAMRKLLHIVFGVLKHQLPFDPDFGRQFDFSS